MGLLLQRHSHLAAEGGKSKAYVRHKLLFADSVFKWEHDVEICQLSKVAIAAVIGLQGCLDDHCGYSISLDFRLPCDPIVGMIVAQQGFLSARPF